MLTRAMLRTLLSKFAPTGGLSDGAAGGYGDAASDERRARSERDWLGAAATVRAALRAISAPGGWYMAHRIFSYLIVDAVEVGYRGDQAPVDVRWKGVLHYIGTAGGQLPHRNPALPVSVQAKAREEEGSVAGADGAVDVAFRPQPTGLAGSPAPLRPDRQPTETTMTASGVVWGRLELNPTAPPASAAPRFGALAPQVDGRRPDEKRGGTGGRRSVGVYRSSNRTGRPSDAAACLSAVHGNSSTEDAAGSWQIFDLGGHRVVPSHYTLKSCGHDHVSSWVLEGTNSHAVVQAAVDRAAAAEAWSLTRRVNSRYLSRTGGDPDARPHQRASCAFFSCL